MNNKKNILLIFGGGGNEHEISILSKNNLKQALEKCSQFNVIEVEIKKNKKWILCKDNIAVYLNSQKYLCHETNNNNIANIDYAIPCLHGAPGETGQIQGLFEIYDIPYFGNKLETSALCMNKVTTKLWLTSIQVPVVDYLTLINGGAQEVEDAKKFLKSHGKVFVKASSEGSSVGIYPADNPTSLEASIRKAFEFCPYVLIEKAIQGREIEVSAYQYDKEIVATIPGEINCPKGFYDYEEKYSEHSKTTTSVVAPNINLDLAKNIQVICRRVFECLKMKDLARMDFFLETNGKFYMNEINTFPGLTPISLFPQMMKHHGHDFSEFLRIAITRDLKL